MGIFGPITFYNFLVNGANANAFGELFCGWLANSRLGLNDDYCEWGIRRWMTYLLEEEAGDFNIGCFMLAYSEWLKLGGPYKKMISA